MPFARCLLCLSLLVPAAARAQEPRPPATLAEAQALVQAAGTAARWPGAATVAAWDGTQIEVEESGLGHTRLRRIEKVLTPAGGKGLAALRFDYDPASNEVQIVHARILRKNGAVEEIAPAAALDLPQPQTMIIWGPRMKLLAFGRLEPGDAVDYEIFRKGFLIAYLGADDDERFIPPMRGHFYDTVLFQERAPLACKHYRAVLPRGKPLRYQVYNGDVSSGAGFDGERLVYSFWKRDVPGFRPEPRAVAESDQCPKVVLATTATWEEKSRWFYEVQEARGIFAAAARKDGLPGGEEEVREIHELVRSLTAGKDREQQIRALNHWVADNIRYMGLSMGKGEGYTIHPGVMILYNRCGVCKDKAGMLTTLLRAAGFEAYAGMTMAGSRVEQIPADQFNHCITAVREPDGSLRILDPTWIPLSPEMWSSAESEQHYLIGTKAGETLQVTPLYGAEHNRLDIEIESRLDAEGRLTSAVDLRGSNYADQRVRRTLYDGAQHRIPGLFSGWAWSLAPGGRVTARRYSADRMTDYSGPAAAGFDLECPGYAVKGERVMAFAPIAAREFLDAAQAPFLGVPLTPERRQDLMLWCTRSIRVEERIALPEGWKASSLPAPRRLDGPAMRLTWTVTPDGDGLVCDLEVALKLRTVPAALYPQFKEVVEAYRGLAAEPILLEPAR